MVAERLSVHVEAGPDVGLIRLSGQLDRDGDEAMRSAYERATVGGASVIRLDFSDVGYINSTGIALIVRLLADARRDRREVRVRGLSAHYREIFRITRLSDFLVLEDEPPP
jgi:anti-anti-sigma factor